jgi:hypothetical protein
LVGVAAIAAAMSASARSRSASSISARARSSRASARIAGRSFSSSTTWEHGASAAAPRGLLQSSIGAAWAAVPAPSPMTEDHTRARNKPVMRCSTPATATEVLWTSSMISNTLVDRKVPQVHRRLQL